ncbi:hypothetical protein QYM36_010370, partial [Artemia franciscana]
DWVDDSKEKRAASFIPWGQPQNKPNSISYISGIGQNELTAIAGTEQVQKIVAEVNKADFFGIFTDGSPAVSDGERLAEDVGYIDREEANEERLIAVVDSDLKKGADIAEKFLQALWKARLKEDKWHFNATILQVTLVDALREHKLTFTRS